MKKNLVIGSGKGYDWYTWEPFIRSFVKNVKNSDLILFVDELSDFTVNQLEKVGKEIKGGNLKLEPFPEDLKEGFIVNNRWKMFLRYVENHGDEYEQIFICDTRDLIFQGDIFECFTDKKNFLGYATEADDIKGSRTNVKLNYQWLESFFDKNIANDLADKDIICCGTVIATTEEMKIFLEKMIEFNPDFHPVGNDQATEQYIIYKKLLPIKNIIKIDCWTGEIFTSFLFHEYNPMELDGNLILRGDGKIPAVVHQYDRSEFLTKLVDRVYRDSNYKIDEETADIKIFVEQVNYLIKTEKFLQALNFLSEHLSPDSDLPVSIDNVFLFWRTLAEKKYFDSFAEGLNATLQAVIIKMLKDGLYINQGRTVFECLTLCKKNNHTIIFGFEDWLKTKIFKAVKWHLDHNNFPRYEGCVNFLLDMNLTDNEYFYFLKAEITRNSGDVYLAADFYNRALDYQSNSFVDRLNLITKYWQNLISNTKENKSSTKN